MSLVLSFRDVEFAYDPGQPVLRAVDLEVRGGEFVAVAGPNGGGKTTLVRLALGLERPTRESVSVLGEPAHRLSQRASLGYLAQRSRLGTDAPATVREVVTAGRLPRSRLWGPLDRHGRERVEEAIRRVGLEAVSARPLGELSGGQQQRAFIAKALAGEPALLVLDEPTTGVDAEAQEALGSLLHELHDELGVTIIYVSHEFGAVERHVERLLLVRGGILFDGPPAQLPEVWHDPSHVHA